jgi:hypothetical protein
MTPTLSAKKTESAAPWQHPAEGQSQVEKLLLAVPLSQL